MLQFSRWAAALGGAAFAKAPNSPDCTDIRKARVDGQGVQLSAAKALYIGLPLAIGPNPPTLPAGWERQISNTGTKAFGLFVPKTNSAADVADPKQQDLEKARDVLCAMLNLPLANLLDLAICTVPAAGLESKLTVPERHGMSAGMWYPYYMSTQKKVDLFFRS